MRENMDEDRMKLALEGCAPKPIILESSDVSDYEDNKTKHQKKSKSYSFKKSVICLYCLFFLSLTLSHFLTGPIKGLYHDLLITRKPLLLY